MKPVSVIIPAKNLADLTVKCIQQIRVHADRLCRIVYCDNGSDLDNHGKVVAALSDGETQCYKSRNAGFTDAINQGVNSAAAEWNTRFYLLLNNDAFINADTVPRLIACLEGNPKLAAVGPITDGPGRHHRGNFAPPDAPTAVIPQRVLAFFCTLIPRWAWDKVGPLDEQFTDGLGADDDWCIRARAMGYQVGIAPAAFCSHLGRQTFRRLNIQRDCSAAYRKLEAKHGSARP